MSFIGLSDRFRLKRLGILRAVRAAIEVEGGTIDFMLLELRSSICRLGHVERCCRSGMYFTFCIRE